MILSSACHYKLCMSILCLTFRYTLPINDSDRPARMPLAPRQPYIEGRVQHVHPIVTVEQPTCSDNNNKTFHNRNVDNSDQSNDEGFNDVNINVKGTYLPVDEHNNLPTYLVLWKNVEHMRPVPR